MVCWGGRGVVLIMWFDLEEGSWSVHVIRVAFGRSTSGRPDLR